MQASCAKRYRHRASWAALWGHRTVGSTRRRQPIAPTNMAEDHAHQRTDDGHPKTDWDRVGAAHGPHSTMQRKSRAQTVCRAQPKNPT
jgi:hypothetical protein